MTSDPHGRVAAQVEILTRLSQVETTYAMLHGWPNVFVLPASDLDVVVSSTSWNSLESHLNKNGRCRVVQVLPYAARSIGYIVEVRSGTTRTIVTLDVSLDYRIRGLVLFSGKELLEGRQRCDDVWFVAPDKEFAFLLVKKIYEKGTVPSHQRERLQQLATQLGPDASPIATRLFGRSGGRLVVSSISSGDWDRLEALVPKLETALRWQVLRRDPLNPLRFWGPEFVRIVKRWWQPTGLMVVILGPDGSGKTTLIDLLTASHEGLFRKATSFHLRPYLLPARSSRTNVSDPHGHAPYSAWLSVLKAAYSAVDYILGYPLKIKPRLMRSGLVLFDRYFDDWFVDSGRYRYAGPMTLLKLLSRLISRPDMVFVVDVAVETLLKRKQEVERDELERQRATYHKLAGELPEAVILDGSQSEEHVCRNAFDMMVEHLRTRYLARKEGLAGKDVARQLMEKALGLRSHQPRIIGQEEESLTFIWLPLRDGRGYLLPLSPTKASVRALDLYSPQNLKSKITHLVLSACLRVGVAQQMLTRVYAWRENWESIGLFQHLQEILGRKDLRFGVALGTPGNHRKPVLLAMTSSGQPVAYIKISWNQKTAELVQREIGVLRFLSFKKLKSFQVPRLLHFGFWNGFPICVQSAPEVHVVHSSGGPTERHLEVLREMTALNTEWLPITRSFLWRELVEAADRVRNSYYRHLVLLGVELLQRQLRDCLVPFCLSHGDFTPWNMKNVTGGLLVFDWEYSRKKAPVGWDLLHFISQNSRLVEGLSAGEVVDLFKRGGTADFWLKILLRDFEVPDEVRLCLFRLYVLERLAHAATMDDYDYRELRHLGMLVALGNQRA